MRIGYFTNRYPAPSHTFIRREIKAVEARGHVVMRYALRSSPEALKDPDDLAEAGITRHVVHAGVLQVLACSLRALVRHPLRCARALLTALQCARDAGHAYLRHLAYFGEALVLADWCERDGVQHLHVHFGTNSAMVAMLMHRVCGVRFSVTVHGPEEFDRPAQLALSRKISAAAFVAAVSSFGRSQLLRWADAEDWHKIAVVPCGIDDIYKQPLAEGPAMGRHLLVCVARLCEQKGHLLLVEAAAELRRQGLPLELVLIGSGPLRDRIEQEIARLGLEDTIHLTGTLSQQEICSWVRKSRGLVLPSFAEGLPVVLMEALALERPVIATFVAGIPELVTPDVGWLIPAGDVHALAGAMREALCLSDDRVLAMGRAGRRRCLERHDIAKSAAMIEDLVLRSAAQPAQPVSNAPAALPKLQGDPA